MNDDLECSFCGRKKSQVQNIIVGYNAAICNDCSDICHEVKKKLIPSKENEPVLSFSSPKEIYDILEKSVEGQEIAKQALAVALFIHCAINNMIPNTKYNSSKKLQNSNILLVGDTGSGKTFLAQQIAEIAGVPFITYSAPTLSATGYVGSDVQDILMELITRQVNAGKNTTEAIKSIEKAIIHLDEFDKIAKCADNAGTPDVSREGAQNVLLPLLEGQKIHIPITMGRKAGLSENISIDTSKMLIICTGAFVGLKKIIEKRINMGSFGFKNSSAIELLNKASMSNSGSILSLVTPEDLISFGMSHEIMGRLPVIKPLQELTRENLISILSNKENSVMKKCKEILDMFGIDLLFSEEAIGFIADLAVARKVGARGLKSIMQQVLQEIIFEIKLNENKETKSIHIDKEFVKNTMEQKISLPAK